MYLSTQHNADWKDAQVRPLTGIEDRKELYQIQFGDSMTALWLDKESLPDFRLEATVYASIASRKH